MKVKNRMTPNPITANPKTTHRQAMGLMNEHNINHLPVVNKAGKLVGVVSRTDLLSTGPSRVTSLSVYEIYNLLDKLTLDQIMSKPVLAVEEDCSLPAAARFMIDNKVSCLMVMSGDELAGIITETDVFKVLVEVMGGGEAGSRVTIQMADKKGQMAAAMRAFTAAGSYIVSVSTFRGAEGAYTIASVKERGADEAKLRAEIDKLETIEIIDLRRSELDRLLRIKN